MSRGDCSQERIFSLLFFTVWTLDERKRERERERIWDPDSQLLSPESRIRAARQARSLSLSLALWLPCVACTSLSLSLCSMAFLWMFYADAFFLLFLSFLTGEQRQPISSMICPAAAGDCSPSLSLSSQSSSRLPLFFSLIPSPEEPEGSGGS